MVFKKKFLIVVAAAVLAFISAFAFYQIQEKDVVIRLDNHNLSQDAYRMKFKAGTNLAEVVTKTRKSTLKDVQLHFQTQQKNVTYFYGKGNFATPPMVSGNFFSQASFVSDVPTAVVGKNLEKQLYKPQAQAYIKIKGNYIPVIGIMGSKYHSELDQQIFIAVAPENLVQKKANAYHVLIDGKNRLEKADIKRAFHPRSFRHVSYGTFIIAKRTWIKEHSTQVLILVGVVVGYLILLLIWFFTSRKNFQQLRFLNDDRQRFVFQEWEFYTLFIGLGLVLGTIVGMMIYSMTSYSWLLIFNGGGMLIDSLFFLWILNVRVKRW
ncbi:hypothetical protein L1O48_00385 [Ligilactobacillus equi]|uniref:hypothetical protein n=1 Tax=Ligilactobacillus equi TaxID=137357 RepID=UPI002ED3A431